MFGHIAKIIGSNWITKVKANRGCDYKASPDIFHEIVTFPELTAELVTA